MAIRFDAVADRLSRTANLPDGKAFTIMGWFKITTDRNAYSTFFCLDSGTGYGALCQTNTDGTTIYVFCEVGKEIDGPEMTVGVWYHLALTGNGTTNILYVNGVSEGSCAYANRTITSMQVGNDAINEWLNGEAFAVKVWGAALSAAEVAQEVRTIRPVLTANLNLWTPLLPGATERLADYSGNGYTWSAGGTLTDEDPPPVSWGACSMFVLNPLTGGVVLQERHFPRGSQRGLERGIAW